MKKHFYYWLCGLIGVLGAFVLFFPNQTVAQTPPLEIKIATGNEVGTYYAIGEDLEELGKQNNLDIDIIPTRGSLQNIHNVSQYESVPLGITQSDILAFLNIFGNDDEAIQQGAKAMSIVSPLYQEEVHLIARREINSIQELDGKRVSVGEPESGTSLTAVTLLYDFGVNPGDVLSLESKQGINALRDGRIDALFYVIGAPARVLEEEISTADNLHLLPLNSPTQSQIQSFSILYEPVTLPANTYSWQPEPVETLAVESVLFTMAGQDCEKVTPVAQMIKDNLSWLQENGEAVWQKVTLEESPLLAGERRSSCAVL